MKEIRISQTPTDGRVTIDLWFKTLDQMFDSSDPFPFPEKELTDRAENAIFESVVYHNPRKEIDLIVHIPNGSVSTDDEDSVANAVRRHFSFRLDDLTRDKKSSWREGQISVFLALINGFISVPVFYIYFNLKSPSFLFYLVVGVFIIANWVTLWDTYEYFVYDYRNLWRKYRVYERLTHINVIIRQTY